MKSARRLAILLLLSVGAVGCAAGGRLNLALNAEDGLSKNVIIFIGDGMGVSTVTAIRIYDGQLKGETGEENILPWEEFPNVALVKTYNTNQQVPDSAGTATAIFTGVKTKAGVIAISPEARRADCESGKERALETIFERASVRKKSTGLVTTARLTHATPAAAYAKSTERDWEADTDMPAAEVAAGCRDIAQQLVEKIRTGTIDVALGGGREKFLPEDKGGVRRDGEDLVAKWKATTPHGEFVARRQELLAISQMKKRALFGLFSNSHMTFELNREEQSVEPSLEEMTRVAINRLKTNPEGFILLVEGGRIDHGHHAGSALLALHDGVAFARAVSTADAMTNDNDTLIVVTADHSHTLTMGGYPVRGNPILGKVRGNDDHGEKKNTFELADDGKPFTTLGYANGPGAVTGDRPDLTSVDTTAAEFKQQSLIPLRKETHGGEDVAIYAKGPGAAQIHGVMEQNEILKWYLEGLR